jgi:PIN domain nuclease of toxin-antitoxin system
VSYLVDTQLLIWLSYEDQKLSSEAFHLLNKADSEIFFSTVSLWEVALKRSKNRTDFVWEIGPLRKGLLDNDYMELPLTGEHILAFGRAVPGHRDPFDRLLVGQAIAEGMILLTADHVLARYDGPIRFMG